MTTEKLKTFLNIPSAATLTIHNVEYPGHPLELALFLSYCTTCKVNKTIYLVIYNEDTEDCVNQNFALDVPIDSFLTPHFIFTALPGLVLWDKYRIYYFYHNFTETGVLQTPTEFGNLSRLAHNSIIHDIFIGEAFSFCKNYSRFHGRPPPHEGVTITNALIYNAFGR